MCVWIIFYNWRCPQMSPKGGFSQIMLTSRDKFSRVNTHWPVLAVDGVSISRRVHYSQAELHSPLLDFHSGRFNLNRALDLLYKNNKTPVRTKTEQKMCINIWGGTSRQITLNIMIYWRNIKSYERFLRTSGRKPWATDGITFLQTTFFLQSFNRQSAQQRDLKGFYIHWAESRNVLHSAVSGIMMKIIFLSTKKHLDTLDTRKFVLKS